MFGPAQHVSACESSSDILVSLPACTEKILTDIRLGFKILDKVEAEIILVLLNDNLSNLLAGLDLLIRHFLAFLCGHSSRTLSPR